MRGTPFLQAILIVALFLLAGVPTYRLTRPGGTEDAAPAPSASPSPTPADAAAPLDIEVAFAPAPADFEIKNLDRTVLAGRGPQAQFTSHWATTVPPEGVDLVVRAHWPTAGPGAVRVTVHFPDGVVFEKTFWAANGEVNEVLTVPGETAPAAP